MLLLLCANEIVVVKEKIFFLRKQITLRTPKKNEACSDPRSGSSEVITHSILNNRVCESVNHHMKG
jgi:hypothetical protein